MTLFFFTAEACSSRQVLCAKMEI